MNKILIVVLVVLIGFVAFRCAKHEKVDQPPAFSNIKLKCSRAECGHEHTAKLALNFNAFPVDCPQCGQRTAYLLTTCPGCQTHYANVDFRERVQHCAKCGAELPPE